MVSCYWVSTASPTLTSTIEIEIPRTHGNQEHAWHPPEGKCHVSSGHYRMLWW